MSLLLQRTLCIFSQFNCLPNMKTAFHLIKRQTIPNFSIQLAQRIELPFLLQLFFFSFLGMASAQNGYNTLNGLNVKKCTNVSLNNLHQAAAFIFKNTLKAVFIFCTNAMRCFCAFWKWNDFF